VQPRPALIEQPEKVVETITQPDLIQKSHSGELLAIRYEDLGKSGNNHLGLR